MDCEQDELLHYWCHFFMIVKVNAFSVLLKRSEEKEKEASSLVSFYNQTTFF